MYCIILRQTCQLYEFCLNASTPLPNVICLNATTSRQTVVLFKCLDPPAKHNLFKRPYPLINRKCLDPLLNAGIKLHLKSLNPLAKCNLYNYTF